MPDLRHAEYAGTISLDSPATIDKYLREKTVNLIIEGLTKPISKQEVPAEAANAREIVHRGTVKHINDFFVSNWWTDGLAIIPPTVETVEEFLKFTSLSSDDEVAVLQPSSVRVTPWNIAVNGVMAGCRPEHMPVLIAGVEAMGDPIFNLAQLGSTGGYNLFFVVNGPVAKQLDIQHGTGLVSRGANTVIGRAMGLIRHNLAGHRPGEVYMGTFGYPLPPVFAEDEELLYEIGWKPFHVDEGFDIGTSTVSVCATAKWGWQMYPTTTDPDRLAQVLAYDVTRAGSANQILRQQESPRTFTIFITPNVARTFAEGGYSKQDAKDAVRRSARYTLAEVDFESYYAAHQGHPETHRDYLARGKLPAVEKGKLPAWLPKVVEGDDATIAIAPRPKQLHIFVCGDPTRNKSMTFYTMYNTLVTKPVKLPVN